MPVITSIQLPEDIYERLRQDAFDKRISQGELVRQAITTYFEAEDDLQKRSKRPPVAEKKA